MKLSMTLGIREKTIAGISVFEATCSLVLSIICLRFVHVSPCTFVLCDIHDVVIILHQSCLMSKTEEEGCRIPSSSGILIYMISPIIC